LGFRSVGVYQEAPRSVEVVRRASFIALLISGGFALGFRRRRLPQEAPIASTLHPFESSTSDLGVGSLLRLLLGQYRRRSGAAAHNEPWVNFTQHDSDGDRRIAREYVERDFARFRVYRYQAAGIVSIRAAEHDRSRVQE
jgi:hypothetical protein